MGVRPLIVRPLAEADLEQAAKWYDGERAGLGNRFLDDVKQVFGRISAAPLQFPIISPNVRRALLRTFPYAVYFDVTEEALSVLHLRRNPGLWQDRP